MWKACFWFNHISLQSKVDIYKYLCARWKTRETAIELGQRKQLNLHLAPHNYLQQKEKKKKKNLILRFIREKRAKKCLICQKEREKQMETLQMCHNTRVIV